jgi:hypothetical protein
LDNVVAEDEEAAEEDEHESESETLSHKVSDAASCSLVPASDALLLSTSSLHMSSDSAEEKGSEAESDDIWREEVDNDKASEAGTNEQEAASDTLWDNVSDADNIPIDAIEIVYCHYDTVYQKETVHIQDMEMLYKNVSFNQSLINIAMDNLMKLYNVNDTLFIPCDLWPDENLSQTVLDRLLELNFFKKRFIFLIVHDSFSIHLMNLNNLGYNGPLSPFMVIVNSESTVTNDHAETQRYSALVKR